jgi:hypothetical protein
MLTQRFEVSEIGELKSLGGKIGIEYRATLDMAKELATIENGNNQFGRAVRGTG